MGEVGIYFSILFVLYEPSVEGMDIAESALCIFSERLATLFGAKNLRTQTSGYGANNVFICAVDPTRITHISHRLG